MIVRFQPFAVVKVPPKVLKIDLRVPVIPAALEIISAAFTPIKFSPRHHHDTNIQPRQADLFRFVLPDPHQFLEIGITPVGPTAHGGAAKGQRLGGDRRSTRSPDHTARRSKE